MKELKKIVQSWIIKLFIDADAAAAAADNATNKIAIFE